jgi:LysR family transcriptional regulator, glycine cleavage system transcriptional activator
MSLMNWKLPPLSALRAFEAAARCGTMTRAGEELHVTQVAISRRVAHLEKSLRTTLFARGGKRLQLTPAGEILLLTVTRVFRDLHNVTEDISGQAETKVLKICGYSNFTMRWLIPRLKLFHSRHPAIDIRLTSSLHNIDFERTDFDAAIRSGSGHWPNCKAVELVPIDLVPVCHPNAAEGLASRGAEALAEATLLHSVARPSDWRMWMDITGIATADPYAGIKFDNGSLAYEAASEGVGVAIAQKALVLDDVRRGRLAFPFDKAVSSGESYWFVWPETRHSGKLAAFRDWLQAVAAEPGVIFAD